MNTIAILFEIIFILFLLYFIESERLKPYNLLCLISDYHWHISNLHINNLLRLLFLNYKTLNFSILFPKLLLMGPQLQLYSYNRNNISSLLQIILETTYLWSQASKLFFIPFEKFIICTHIFQLCPPFHIHRISIEIIYFCSTHSKQKWRMC